MPAVMPGYRAKSRTQVSQHFIQCFHLPTCQTSEVRKLKYIHLHERGPLKERVGFLTLKDSMEDKRKKTEPERHWRPPLRIRSVGGKCVKYESVGDVPSEARMFYQAFCSQNIRNPFCFKNK